jgi:hypothetical protein
MTRKVTKQKRLDLWLDDADLTRLTDLADGWQISRQRVIESALTYATAVQLQPVAGNGYTRRQRIPLQLDALAVAQVDLLAADADASDGIRAALRAFHAQADRP